MRVFGEMRPRNGNYIVKRDRNFCGRARINDTHVTYHGGCRYSEMFGTVLQTESYVGDNVNATPSVLFKEIEMYNWG